MVGSRGPPWLGMGPPWAYTKFPEVLKKFLYTDLELKMGYGSMTHIYTFLVFHKYLKNDKSGLERLFSRDRRCPICQNDRLDEDNKKA